MKNFSDANIMKIAVGSNGNDYNWTDVVMRELGNSVWGLAFPYYTWNTSQIATDVDESSWYRTMLSPLVMEELVSKYSTIMGKYDPGKSVALAVGDWGMWHGVELGTNPGFLYQQNTLRDAIEEIECWQK